jgi:hypothetical protein
MEPDDGEPEEAPSSLPPDPFARNQESAVGLHEGYMWLRSGGFSMVEALIYLAASSTIGTMIAVQEAVLAAQHETPEAPEQD